MSAAPLLLAGQGRKRSIYDSVMLMLVVKFDSDTLYFDSMISCSRLESLFSTRGRYFASSNMRAWKNYPFIVSTYEMAYFSSIFLKFCALHWSLRAWHFACARKIFSVHYILSSLAYVFGQTSLLHANAAHGPVVAPKCMTFLVVSKLSFLLKLIYTKSFFMVLICITKCVSTTDYHKAVSIKQNTFLA